MNQIVGMLTIGLFFSNPAFWIVIILAILSLIFGKKIVGKAGEFSVQRELNKLNKQDYLIINDITIKDSNNYTHQIDHVVISKYGIFVIETKQYNGYIQGGEYDKNWVQNKKIQIHNPIHQNYGHVKSLCEILNLHENFFIPIVCIPSTAKTNIKTTKNYVVRLNELNKVILSYSREVLTNYQDLYNRLLSFNITDKEALKQHVKMAKKKQINNNINSLNKCPRCGGDLVLRTSSKDGTKFWGCSNFPRCRYTKSM